MPDPAAGKFEFAGGHMENGEVPRQAAVREWQEETGLNFPDGEFTGSWVSANGIYEGFVYTIPREADLDIFARQIGSDPDGDVDGSETIAWWDPADLPGNPAIRPELLADISAVMSALGCTEGAAGDCCGADCCAGGCCNGAGNCQCGTLADDPTPVVDEVAKAVTTGPKAGKGRHWPGWDLDLKAVEHWAPLLAAALSGALSKAQAEQIAAAYIAGNPAGDQAPQGKREAVEAAAAWLAGQGVNLASAVAPLIPGILADAHLIGGVSAQAMTDGGSADLGGWQPGDTDIAQHRVDELGIGAGLSAALDASDQTAEQMAGGYMTKLGRALADGIASGLGAAAIGASLIAALSDPDDPNGSVLTAIVAGIGAAALAWYKSRSVQQLDFLTANDGRVCAQCDACQDGSPYTAASVPDVPQHTRCRCAIVPA